VLRRAGRRFCFLLIIAGNETTTKLLANCLLALQRFPSERAKVASDPGRIPDAVEEILRYEGSTQLMARTLTRPVGSARRARCPRGAKVLLPARLGESRRTGLGPARRVRHRAHGPVQHVGFRARHSRVPRRALARLEMRVSLEGDLPAHADYEIDETGCTRVHSGNVRGWATVPIHCRA
jgi:cytochrome P450